MVIKDAFRNKILWYKFAGNETVAGYLEGVGWLRDNSFTIHGIVCDGSPGGLFSALGKYRVQMCQFHRAMIVRRYLTSKLNCLRPLNLWTSPTCLHTPTKSFIGMLDDWSERWTSFMGNAAGISVPERRLTRTSASECIHEGLRRNMPWLWNYITIIPNYIYPIRTTPWKAYSRT